MSRTPKTRDTNPTISNNLLETQTQETQAPTIIETTDPKLSTQSIKAKDIKTEKVNTKLETAAKLLQLESQVELAKHGGFEWLEVDPDVLMHFNSGKIPSTGYSIYKNIRLCLENTAEDIAKRESITVFEVLHKEDAKTMRVDTNLPAHR